MNAKHFNAFLSRVPVSVLFAFARAKINSSRAAHHSPTALLLQTFVAFFYGQSSQQSKLAMPEFAKVRAKTLVACA